MSGLADIVEFYRLVGRPQLTDDGRFVFDGTVEAPARAILARCAGKADWFDETPRRDGTSRVECDFPRHSDERGYGSLEQFFTQTPNLSRAQLPSQFYIAKEDFFSEDLIKPNWMAKLQALLGFVQALTSLAEAQMPVGDSVNRLLFFLSKDGGKVQRTALLDIRPEQHALQFEAPNISVLQELATDENNTKLHVLERKLLMRTSIADVLETLEHGENELTFIYRSWASVMAKFSASLHAYVNNYAFEEVRKKIVDAELDYSSKLGSAFSEATNKVLALPVSLVAIAALDATQKGWAFIIGCTGYLIVSLILLVFLVNSWFQVKRLERGFKFVFGPIFSKSDTYPKTVSKELNKRKDSLRWQSLLTNITFGIFFALTAFGVVAVWLRLHDKYPNLSATLLGVFKRYLHS